MPATVTASGMCQTYLSGIATPSSSRYETASVSDVRRTRGRGSDIAKRIFQRGRGGASLVRRPPAA